jgi:hypothetical protein
LRNVEARLGLALPGFRACRGCEESRSRTDDQDPESGSKLEDSLGCGEERAGARQCFRKPANQKFRE